MKSTTYKLLTLINLLLQVSKIETCNEYVCGSVVTKCLLTESCSCTLDNSTCCRQCFNCLGDVFDECCSCIDLCPSVTNTWTTLSKTSYVEEFEVKIPHLFMALTEQPDPVNRWSVHTYSIELDKSILVPKLNIPLHVQTEGDSVPKNSNLVTLNCTVVYLSTCKSMQKCKSSCQSMGASGIRWFHDGCCECIGDTCINYGLNESQCQECGEDIENDEEEDEEYDGDIGDEELDYGETLDEDDYLDYGAET